MVPGWMCPYHPLRSRWALHRASLPAAAALDGSRLVDAALCVSPGPALDASASSAFTGAAWLVRSCLLLTSRLQWEALARLALTPGLRNTEMSAEHVACTACRSGVMLAPVQHVGTNAMHAMQAKHIAQHR